MEVSWNAIAWNRNTGRVLGYEVMPRISLSLMHVPTQAWLLVSRPVLPPSSGGITCLCKARGCECRVFPVSSAVPEGGTYKVSRRGSLIVPVAGLFVFWGTVNISPSVSFNLRRISLVKVLCELEHDLKRRSCKKRQSSDKENPRILLTVPFVVYGQ